MSGKNQEKGILRWMKNFIFQIFSLTVETLTNLGGGGGGGCTRAVLGYLFLKNVSMILELFQTISQRKQPWEK